MVFLCSHIYSNGKINHQKWVLLRDTCDYPATSNAYSTRVLEPKLSEYMKEKKKLPNYFSHKWNNYSIYNGLMVVLNVRNMERE